MVSQETAAAAVGFSTARAAPGRTDCTRAAEDAAAEAVRAWSEVPGEAEVGARGRRCCASHPVVRFVRIGELLSTAVRRLSVDAASFY
ncbi:hypothetical protein CD934_27020 [Streptomyces calvus]|uniref:Uncharacterized protein n=1 Tax=Streptomyces calvus TaxID=67282 RepID=A0A514JYL3_9ACTN|nr:hypothetical protein CD934_27020 [Streptomyces calvus]